MMSKKQATTSSTIVTRTLFLNSKSFCVLFDSSATHSFISTRSVLQLDLESVKVETNYRIKLPKDSIVDCSIFYKHILISTSGSIFLRDFIQLDLSDFNIILGMNWLCTYGAKSVYEDLKVIFNVDKSRTMF